MLTMSKISSCFLIFCAHLVGLIIRKTVSCSFSKFQNKTKNNQTNKNKNKHMTLQNTLPSAGRLNIGFSSMTFELRRQQ